MKSCSPSEIIEKIEASTIESKLNSNFSYQSIKTIYKISCADLRNNIKMNLIHLNHILENLYFKINATNLNDSKNEIRKSFVQNSENSIIFPSINELKNLWSIYLDWKDDIFYKIQNNKFLMTKPEFRTKIIIYFKIKT